ncbi:hypothetical protein FALCPG4_003202, partial [Fusarium falciforme]
ASSGHQYLDARRDSPVKVTQENVCRLLPIRQCPGSFHSASIHPSTLFTFASITSNNNNTTLTGCPPHRRHYRHLVDTIFQEGVPSSTTSGKAYQDRVPHAQLHVLPAQNRISISRALRPNCPSVNCLPSRRHSIRPASSLRQLSPDHRPLSETAIGHGYCTLDAPTCLINPPVWIVTTSLVSRRRRLPELLQTKQQLIRGLSLSRFGW